MSRSGLFLLPLILVAFACVSNKTAVQRVEGEDILLGKVDREQLFEAQTDWMNEYINYAPSSALIDSLKRLAGDVKVEIFLGSWCSDSRRDVPRFYKILDQCGENAFPDISIWAVDRHKKIPDNNITDEREVWFVATFIFYRENKELGRIVERPAKSLEADMLKIL